MVKQTLREWYLYIPLISWVVLANRYLGGRPKLKGAWEQIDRNMDDVELNTKVVYGNTLWLIVVLILVVLT